MYSLSPCCKLRRELCVLFLYTQECTIRESVNDTSASSTIRTETVSWKPVVTLLLARACFWLCLCIWIWLAIPFELLYMCLQDVEHRNVVARNVAVYVRVLCHCIHRQASMKKRKTCMRARSWLLGIKQNRGAQCGQEAVKEVYSSSSSSMHACVCVHVEMWTLNDVL